MKLDFTLLEKLVRVHAPSGSERPMQQFLINHVKRESKNWKVQPELIYGEHFQDCLILKFGQPRTAIFSHIDSIGFTVGYNNELIKIGSPVAKVGFKLVGKDSKGSITCTIREEEDDYQHITLRADFKREIDRGTTLTFKPNFRQEGKYVISPYMDNRMGVYNALEVARTLQHGLICFSCWEEHHAGSVGYLTRYMYEELGVRQALISDITWVTEGVKAGKGAAVSMRDSGIPRRVYLDKVLGILEDKKIKHQLEVERAGGSDGQAIQRSPYPVDWVFVGAPESGVHSPDEKVHTSDLESMIRVYKALMREL